MYLIGLPGSGLLSSVSPLVMARAPERKEAGLGIPEIKTAVDDLGRIVTEFRQKNDDRLKQLEKKGEDAVTKDEVEKLNKGIDDAKADLKKRLDEMEAKANRLQLSTGDAALEAKAAAAFGDLVSKGDYSPEELKEYRADLAGYFRRGEVKAATMQVASDPSGGYWVTPDASGRMLKKIYESTPMRQLATVVSIGTDTLEGPIDNGELDAAWVGESAQRKETDASQIGKWSIPVNELYAYPKVTQKLLEDARIDVEAWLADKAAGKFSRKENAAFLNGDGVLKPKGLLTYDTATDADDIRKWGVFQHILSGQANGIGNADKLIDLIFELKAGYRQAAQFLAARRTLGAVRKLKDGQGNYLVDLRLRDGALVESIFGYPVNDGEDMPSIAAGNVPLVFGDIAETYTIVDRLGVSAVRDNITQPGFVKFLMRKRVGGGAINFESAKFLKIGA